MNNQAKKQLIDDFVSYTCTSREISQNFLANAKWNLQNAINNFYDQGAPMPPPPKTNISVGGINDVQNFWNANNAQAGEGQNVKIINEDGLEKLFSKVLKIDMENVVIGHIMINVMQMKKAGEATKDNLYNLLKYTNCKNFAQVSNNVGKLEKQIKERKDLFRKMYFGFFQFYSVTKIATLDFQIAQQIWITYLKNIMPYYPHFVQYLKSVKDKYAKIHKDLWKMTYQFASNFKNVSSYNQSDGWPLFLDNFVKYLIQRNIT